MYGQIDNPGYWSDRAAGKSGNAIVAQPGQLDALVALERIGTWLGFSRNDEIYAEGGAADAWYKVVSGTVRICKLLPDGRPSHCRILLQRRLLRHRPHQRAALLGRGAG